MTGSKNSTESDIWTESKYLPEKMVRCPDCGAENGDGAISCNSCGRPLDYGHLVAQGTYLGMRVSYFSNNLILGATIFIAFAAIVGIPMALLVAPPDLRIAAILLVVFVLLAILGIMYGIYRGTKDEGPIVIGEQSIPSVGEADFGRSPSSSEDSEDEEELRKRLRPI